MVKVVKGVRPDLGAIPRCRPPVCAGFLNLMQRCWTTDPNTRPSFQGKLAFIKTPSPRMVVTVTEPDASLSPPQKSHLKLKSSALNLKRSQRTQPYRRQGPRPTELPPVTRYVTDAGPRTSLLRKHCVTSESWNVDDEITRHRLLSVRLEGNILLIFGLLLPVRGTVQWWNFVFPKSNRCVV